MATERYRRNSIAMLRDSDGNEITDHQAMAGLLWADYKGRMGHLDGINMQFDLDRIFKRVEGLDELTKPFTKKK
jgi:hypothetical protein